MKRVVGATGWVVLTALYGCMGPFAAHEDAPLPAQRIPSLRCGEPPVQAGDCQHGAECGEGQRCGLDTDVPQPDRGPITLRCGPPQGVLEERAPCSAGGDCASGLCALTGVCLAPCRVDVDCQEGLSCQRVEARVGAAALAPLRACARSTAFAPDVAVSVAEPIKLRAGRLEQLPVTLATGRALLALKVECGRTLRVQRMIDRESGTVLFDVAAQLDGVVQLNPLLNQGDLVPVLLPNNPRVLLPATTYELGVTVDADTTLQIVSAAATRGHRKLDLNVFYVGGGRAATPDGLHPGDVAFAEVLARLIDRYAAVGLEVGTIREFDVVGRLRAELSELRTNESGQGFLVEVDRLGDLFALTAGLDAGGLNVFLVRSMGPLHGISGGVPGALGFLGTAASGVALALDTVGFADADRALFHELGHQFGLFHTSEIDGSTVEPLSDTQACSAAHDADRDGILTNQECAALDGDNLMFWEGRGDRVSAQQAELLRQSLGLR